MKYYIIYNMDDKKIYYRDERSIKSEAIIDDGVEHNVKSIRLQDDKYYNMEFLETNGFIISFCDGSASNRFNYLKKIFDTKAIISSIGFARLQNTLKAKNGINRNIFNLILNSTTCIITERTMSALIPHKKTKIKNPISQKP